MSVRRMLLAGRQTRGGGGGGEAIPEGAIALWSDVLGNIPPNWNLCDGTGVTPNLVARFLRGAPAATEPGTTGGSDTHNHTMTAAGSHTHTAQGGGDHSHTVNSAGNHDHGNSAFQMASPEDNPGMHMIVGDHSHNTNASGTHTHTMDTYANHSHTIASPDARPPYYEVAFIQAGAGALIAVGLIIIWTGLLANIPAGWDLCDGGGARPDLRATFVRGVNTAITNPGGVGGADTHTHALSDNIIHSHTQNVSGHNHSFNAYTWTHDHNTLNLNAGNGRMRQTDSGGGNHTHSDSNTPTHSHAQGNSSAFTAASHTVNNADSKPAYYDVAYIFNTAAASIPPNGILIWTGILATIPAGYNLCDGGGGRPELRSKFLRGSNAAVDPGGLGGSDTHTHTEGGNVGAHIDHSVTLAGAHTHNATNSTGAHTHSTATDANVGGAFWNESLNDSDGAHSHTYNAHGNHNDHTLTSAGDHDHQPWNTPTVQPAFYEVLFIMLA